MIFCMQSKCVYNAYERKKPVKSGFYLVYCTTSIMNDDGKYECKHLNIPVRFRGFHGGMFYI